jgi:hypothetical protein
LEFANKATQIDRILFCRTAKNFGSGEKSTQIDRDWTDGYIELEPKRH